MQNQDRLDRREFTAQAALALLGGAVITITGCGGGGSSPSAPSPPASGGDRAGAVSANHGHVAVITAAQLSAAGSLTLNIRGSATHPHTVELTAVEVAQVRDGQRVSKISTIGDSHNHNVTFN